MKQNLGTYIQEAKKRVKYVEVWRVKKWRKVVRKIGGANSKTNKLWDLSLTTHDPKRAEVCVEEWR